MNAFGANRVHERSNNVVLPHEIRELRGTPFARKYYIRRTVRIRVSKFRSVHSKKPAPTL